MEYLVTWSITIDADSPDDAAMQAQAIATDPATSATVYVVEDKSTVFYFDTETNPATLIRQETLESSGGV